MRFFDPKPFLKMDSQQSSDQSERPIKVILNFYFEKQANFFYFRDTGVTLAALRTLTCQILKTTFLMCQ